MLREYYVYRSDDADSVPRYVGKGRGRRAAYHEAMVRALLAHPKTKRATRVHRLMLKDGLKFAVGIVANQFGDEGQQLRSNSLRHLGVRIVPRPVNNQAVGMKLRGKPTSFGQCIREVRIACAHHDEPGDPAVGYDGCRIRRG